MSRAPVDGERSNGVSRDERLALALAIGWAASAAIAGRAGIWLALGGAAILLGATSLVVDGARLRALLRPGPIPILVGALAGGSMAIATFALYPPLARAAPWIGSDTAQLYAAFGALSVAKAALALAPVVLGEEVVWRGVVQGALARRFGPVAAVILAAAAYALAHAPVGSPVLLATTLACGLAWGALRAATGNLVAPLVSHLMWDAIVLLAHPVTSG